jgi:uncharacterized protein (DUF305 family)
MHRSPVTLAGLSLRWLVALTALVLMVPAGAIRAQDTTGMGPDQMFLRHTLQEHTGATLVVHGALHRPGTFPAKTDAAKIDNRLDDEIDRLRAALKNLYNDNFAPQPRDLAHAIADSLTKLSGPKYDYTFRNWFIDYDQLQVQVIDKTMPKLTNATVKALAQKMRASATSEITMLKAEVNVPVPS